MITLLQVNRDELEEILQEVVTDALRNFDPTPPERPKPDRIDSVDEVAEITQLSVSRIYKMTASGEIPCARYGPRRLVFSRKELEKWMKERTTAPVNLKK